MLDARETAPFQSHKDMYLDENDNVIENASRIGPLCRRHTRYTCSIKLCKYKSMDPKKCQAIF
jgi:hypothetical protein